MTSVSQKVETPTKVETPRSGLGAKKIKKSVVPRLKSSFMDLSSLRSLAKEELESILDNILTKISPQKDICLVLDPSLVGPLTLIIPFKSLTDKNVDPTIHTIEDAAWKTDIQNIVYLTRPRLESIKKISNQIKSMENLAKKTYHLFMVPRKTLISEITLQKLGVFQLIDTIGEYALDILPVDNDLISMENPFVYRELTMDSDNSSLLFVARSLMKIQSIYGVIPKIKYFGPAGSTVAKMLNALKTKLKTTYQFRSSMNIGNLILFDRSMDMVTPFLTQLNYEGLIDELYGINNNLLTVQLKEKNKEKESKFTLNDDDEVFFKVRHKNFNAIGKELNKEANVVTELYDEKNKMQNPDTDLKTIKEFVSKLPALQQRHEDLGKHIALAQIIRDETSKISFRKNIEMEQAIIKGENEEEILNYIEELIIKQEPLPKVLRLICLLSSVNDGLADKAFESFRKELIHSYGFQFMTTLYNLEYCGLIKRRETYPSIDWKSVTKYLQLIDENVEEEKPSSISYVHSGYAPLSVRIIERYGASENKDKWMELKNIFPDAEIGEISQSESSDLSSTMVFFLGGITYSEISALRFLANEKGFASGKCLIATTKLINGNTFMGSMFDQD